MRYNQTSWLPLDPPKTSTPPQYLERRVVELRGVAVAARAQRGVREGLALVAGLTYALQQELNYKKG